MDNLIKYMGNIRFVYGLDMDNLWFLYLEMVDIPLYFEGSLKNQDLFWITIPYFQAVYHWDRPIDATSEFGINTQDSSIQRFDTSDFTILDPLLH